MASTRRPLFTLALAIAGSACGPERTHAPAASKAQAGATGATGAMVQPVVLSPPEKLGAWAGPNAQHAADQRELVLYGTDLGVSFVHGGELRVLFGDTWADGTGNTVAEPSDDSQAAISLAHDTGFPDGAAVEAYLAAHTGDPAQPFFRRAVPPLEFVTNPESSPPTIAPIELFRGGDRSRPPLDMGAGKTVVTAFSNARDGAFAIFRRDVWVACANDGDPKCDEGYACDEELGFCADTTGEFATPCFIGGTRCSAGVECVRPPGGGLCQDRTSSLYKDGDEDARLESVVIAHEIGSADPEHPERYATRTWITNKFTNPIAKPVADFDEARDPSENDYRPADGSQPAREKVLLWGRPHSVGTKSVGRDARLYFGYADMPEASASGDFAWNPRYLSAIEDGRPRFSSDPSRAIALELGGGSDPNAELFDVVDKMALSYLPAFGQWVMFYGGDFPPPILNLFNGPNYGRIERDPKGAIHARFAKHPWGPWSAPVTVLEAGNPDQNPPAPGSEYAPGGILHHPGCTDPDCIAGTPSVFYALTPAGFLYAPNIIDPWITARENGRAVDVYWNVSTWNPYQVVLLKTRIVAE